MSTFAHAPVNGIGRSVPQFGAGFLVTGLAVVVQQLAQAGVADVPWRLNPDAGLFVPGNGAARLEATGLWSLLLNLLLPLALVAGVCVYLLRAYPRDTPRIEPASAP